MMNPIRTLSLTLFMTLTLVATSSWARDLDGQKGIGFAQAIGGPNGLAFNYGIGTLNLETIFGMSRFSTQNEDTDPQLMIATSAGLHFQLLSSENGAFCVGARFNLATGSTQVGVRDSGGALGLTETRDVTQVGFDIPLRVYWFPTRHISIHSEFGLAFLMGSEDALLISAQDGDAVLQPEGLAIIAFRQSAPLGQLGLTFWW